MATAGDGIIIKSWQRQQLQSIDCRLPRGGERRELLRADTYSARLGWDFGNLFVALTDSQVAKEKQLEKLYAYFAH